MAAALGILTEAVGKVVIRTGDGRVREGRRGTEVFREEVVVAVGDGSHARVNFFDGTFLNLMEHEEQYIAEEALTGGVRGHDIQPMHSLVVEKTTGEGEPATPVTREEDRGLSYDPVYEERLDGRGETPLDAAMRLGEAPPGAGKEPDSSLKAADGEMPEPFLDRTVSAGATLRKQEREEEEGKEEPMPDDEEKPPEESLPEDGLDFDRIVEDGEPPLPDTTALSMDDVVEGEELETFLSDGEKKGAVESAAGEKEIKAGESDPVTFDGAPEQPDFNHPDQPDLV